MRHLLAFALLFGSASAYAAPVPKELRKVPLPDYPSWHIYKVPSGSAAEVAGWIKGTVFDNYVIALAKGNDTVMACVKPDDHKIILAYLAHSD